MQHSLRWVPLLVTMTAMASVPLALVCPATRSAPSDGLMPMPAPVQSLRVRLAKPPAALHWLQGLQPFSLRHFQGGGGSALRLTYSLNGQAAVDVPAAWWSHTR